MFFHNLFSFSGFLLGVTCTLLAIILFRFGKLRQHRMMAIYNVAVAVWGFGAFLWGNQKDFFWVATIVRVSHIGVILIPVLFLHTVAVFCNTETRLKNLLTFAYLQAIFFLCLLPTEFFISSRNPRILFDLYVFIFDIKSDFLFFIYVVLWGGLFIVGHYELFKYLQKAPKIIKGQTFFVMITWFIIFLSGLSLYAVPFNIPIYPFGNFILTVYYCLLTYLVFKYRFIDVLLVFIRLLASLVVYSFVLGVPLILGFLWQADFIKLLGSWWWLVPLVTATLTSALGITLYSYLDKKAQEKILKEQKDYQSVLKEASGQMILIRELDHLLNLIVDLVTKTAKIEHASIYLFDPPQNQYLLKASRGRTNFSSEGQFKEIPAILISQFLSEKKPILAEEVLVMLNAEPQNQKWQDLLGASRILEAELVIPSFVEHGLVMVLVLGKKASDKPYSLDDMNIFSVLANQAGLVIENLKFYEEIRRVQEELAVTEKLATIGTMANCLSHLINNRFQAISLSTANALELLKNVDAWKCSDDIKNIFTELMKTLEHIEANVFRGSYVIKGLLDYSKPGENGFGFVDMEFVLEEAIQAMQEKIQGEGITLIKNIQARVEKLFGNWMQLEEVFINLLDNAYDAIVVRKALLKEEGYQGKIEIVVAKTRDSLELKIIDNGMGIKDEHKKMLFTPFFTMKATVVKGKGLGLYVIGKIIQAHHGAITIDSQYQSGTTVTLVFPLP